MGNLCGKQSKDNFSGQGRTLDTASAPAPKTRAPVPAKVKQAGTSSEGRALGGPEGSNDPRSAAAKAAEARAQNAQGTGKLGKQLYEQKRQTRSATLEDVSAENRAHRNADATAETRNWN